jgi:NADH-quinone oxidoreductase subunit F
MAWVAARTVDFFAHESCGKCSPCREGTYWLRRLYDRVLSGEGSRFDTELIANVIAQMKGNCFCPLGEFAQEVPRATLGLFADDYAHHVGDEDAP